jgi:primosomal protein N' (replication factor Y)
MSKRSEQERSNSNGSLSILSLFLRASAVRIRLSSVIVPKSLMMQSLFPNLEVPAEPKKKVVDRTPTHPGPYASVALERGIDRMLDYGIPPQLVPDLKVGQRVKVPLGRKNRPTAGYVIGISATTDYPRVKPMLAIEDDRVLVAPPLMRLARWMSRYYITPLGTVLESVIPAAVKKRIGLGYRQMVRPAVERDQLQQTLETLKMKKRRAVLARLLQVEPGQAIEIVQLASEAGTTVATVRKLSKMGLITITSEVDLPGFAVEASVVSGDAGIVSPNEQQQRVLDEMLPRVTNGGFSVNLLMGVTGSGKTEVYLRCIDAAVRQGKQAIVLVPEIALTPQTVRRFTARFPAVAVLHSGLSQSQRHRFWQQIATGRASVVVGARSAVFAPTPNLGIIVVDEEHEPSYKQDQAPRYHGRDVATKRGQLEGVPVILGSATPSLETYQRVLAAADSTKLGVPPAARPPVSSISSATDSKEEDTGSKLPVAHKPAGDKPYHLLTLANRVRGLALPHVEIIDMKQEARMRRGVHLIGARMEHLLRTTVAAGQQAILLLNRRGYSNFVYCSSCTNPIQCKYCDSTMTYHRSAGAHANTSRAEAAVHTGQLHCHYCLAVNPLPVVCPVCGKKLTLFGLGTQRVEEEIARKFPELNFARVDSDSMHGLKDYEALLSRFARGEVQVLLGTQMIAKGLDYPNVTLVGVINGDTALSLPDFRAAERTFQLITQVAGRAGRGDKPGRVVLQTFMPEDPTINAAMAQNYVAFAKTELSSRREVGLPPFSRMVRIVIRDQDSTRLADLCEAIAAELNAAVAAMGNAVTVKGPMPCAIGRIAGYFRNQIVLSSPRADSLQRVLAELRTKGQFAKAERVAVDVDPVSLL